MSHAHIFKNQIGIVKIKMYTFILKVIITDLQNAEPLLSWDNDESQKSAKWGEFKPVCEAVDNGT